MKKTVVGAVKVNKPFEYVNNNFEVAAWSETHLARQGVYPLVMETAYHSPYQLKLTAEIGANVTHDYFPALWGGVAIGETKPKHIGEERIIRKAIEINEAIQSYGNTPDGDLNIWLAPEWWQTIQEEAERELAEAYRRLPEFWAQYAGLDQKTFVPSMEGRWDFRMERDSKLSMVAHFGEQLDKWARRLQLLARHQGYMQDAYFHQLHVKNTEWAKAIPIQRAA